MAILILGLLAAAAYFAIRAATRLDNAERRDALQTEFDRAFSEQERLYTHRR